jgi:hypothetical protein
MPGGDADEGSAEKDPGDRDGHGAIRPETTEDRAPLRGDRTVRDDRPGNNDRALARRDQPGGGSDRVHAVLQVVSGGTTPRPKSGGGRRSRIRWAAQASDDALDTDRCVEQYGLLDVDGPAALGVARGWGSHAGTVRGRGIELGSLFAAEIPSPRAYDIVANPITDVAERATGASRAPDRGVVPRI